MKTLLGDLRDRLGDVALVAMALIVLGAILLMAAVRPLEQRLAAMEERQARSAQKPASDAESLRNGSPAAKLAGFYAFFDRSEGQVDWLAKLYGCARSQGLELRAADYRLVEASGRMIRYEVTLPLTGTYVQLRDFIENALEEIPVLSLDQINFRRKRTADAMLEAEAVFTLHLMKP